MEQMRALFHSVFGNETSGKTLAVILLRMGRAEVQTGAYAHGFEFFHQGHRG